MTDIRLAPTATFAPIPGGDYAATQRSLQAAKQTDRFAIRLARLTRREPCEQES